MEERQTLLTIVVVLAVGLIAYLVGERRATRRAASASPAKASTESSPREVVASPKPVGAESAPSRVTADAEASAAPKSRPATKQSQSTPKLEPVASAGTRSPVGSMGLLSVPSVVEYEEDDNVEPTRVGPAASAPPSKRVILQPPVKRIVFDDDATTDEPTRTEPLFLVHATMQTDKGLRRKRNEDCLGVLESRNLFIVADGMGGYAGGDQASKLSVDTIMDAFRSNTFEGPHHDGIPREASDLARAIQMANAAIGEEAQRHHALVGMGTTVCAAVFSPNKRRLYIGHVGDSRCYRLRDGVFKQITADHTMAELGVKGPEGQQLSRAVGIWPTVTIDIVMAVPVTGDVYLLCSDGLTKMLPDEVIGNVLRNEEDPKAAVERLIFFANSRGGKDNITVVLVRVVPIEWKGSNPPPPAGDDAPPTSSGSPPDTSA